MLKISSLMWSLCSRTWVALTALSLSISCSRSSLPACSAVRSSCFWCSSWNSLACLALSLVTFSVACSLLSFSISALIARSLSLSSFCRCRLSSTFCMCSMMLSSLAFIFSLLLLWMSAILFLCAASLSFLLRSFSLALSMRSTSLRSSASSCFFWSIASCLCLSAWFLATSALLLSAASAAFSSNVCSPTFCSSLPISHDLWLASTRAALAFMSSSSRCCASSFSLSCLSTLLCTFWKCSSCFCCFCLLSCCHASYISRFLSLSASSCSLNFASLSSRSSLSFLILSFFFFASISCFFISSLRLCSASCRFSISSRVSSAAFLTTNFPS
mmetsp:Transcript_26676/g.67276  ORF Transcript_26676/g.67276 Transcript_26676/m.67276 type:complete len:330 (-) Transcript_26676:576-1565(-)